MNKKYTIDLDSHTLSNSKNIYQLFHITLGTVTVENGILENSFSHGIRVSGGNVSLDKLTVTASTASNSLSYAVYVNSGTVSMLSGTDSGYESGVYCSGGTVTITTGSEHVSV